MTQALNKQQIDEVIERWSGYIDQAPLYAFGFSKTMWMYHLLEKPPLFSLFKGLYDNSPDMWNRRVNGLKVLPLNEIKNRPGPIVVFPQAWAAIRRQLEEYGLVENVDFIRRDDFLAIYHYHRLGEICFPQSPTILLTSRCTLRCRQCSHYIPDLEEHVDVPVERLKEEAELLFSLVDKMCAVSCIGGEPLLYPHLGEYLNFIGDKFRDKFYFLALTTNGTLKPGPELLKIFKKFDLAVAVSDYSGAGIKNYEKNFRELLDLLRQEGLCHSVSRQEWISVEQKEADRKLSLEALNRKYADCVDRVQCPIYHDGKLYPCGTQYLRERRGDLPHDGLGVLDFRQMSKDDPSDRRRLLRFALRHCESGHLPACRDCHSVDSETVPAGLQ